MPNVENKTLKAKLRENNSSSLPMWFDFIFRDYACYFIEINFLFNVGSVTPKSILEGKERQINKQDEYCLKDIEKVMQVNASALLRK